MNNHRSIREPGTDYTSAREYFVTLVTYGRECLFGDVISGEMVLNEWGCLAKMNGGGLGRSKDTAGRFAKCRGGASRGEARNNDTTR
jgi:hypothetical protein